VKSICQGGFGFCLILEFLRGHLVYKLDKVIVRSPGSGSV
jgi:hypothetical protein